MHVTDTLAVAQTEPPDLGWTPPTWEEIVTAHSARVYRLAYRLTGNPHDAEDLTHDAVSYTHLTLPTSDLV